MTHISEKANQVLVFISVNRLPSEASSPEIANGYADILCSIRILI